ncbi:MAG TPA: dihydropteroate synthase [Steroidobacteraceae bacterium]|nr:dihydropteroate synthase [Steroidobacteraceae bacterium]
MDLAHPIVMGVLNVTPDSFYDGGRYATLSAALERGATLVDEGASIIDVGGESTRPGAAEVGATLEMERVVPLIEALVARFDIAISIDTSKLGVMAAAVAAGASIVNDVHSLRAGGAREWAASAGVGVCLMHMQGEPRTMQEHPRYGDVVAEVAAFLDDQRAACVAAGIAPEAIALDPGIGFGKTVAHNSGLLRGLPSLVALGSPLLVGVSRKSLIGHLLGGRTIDQRLHGGLGLAALSVAMGAKIIRTHDVAPTLDAIRVVDAVMQG